MPQQDHDRRIDYIEFQVTDIQLARNFYSTVFGWTFTDYGPDYTCFADGRLAGGFARAETASSGGPLVVLYAVNLALVEKAVKANGGTIVRDIYDFPGGRRFHFRDPSGYELAVWSE